MKASSRIRLEQLAERPIRSEVEKLGWAEWKALLGIMERRMVEKAQPRIELLANMGDSPDEVKKFRLEFGLIGRDQPDIGGDSDRELIELRNQLRDVWVEAERRKDVTVPKKWFDRFPLADEAGWLVMFPIGAFIPTTRNFTAIMARFCFENAHLLARCANPDCNRFFVASRRGQKYCLEPGCLAYGNRQRANKWWNAHMAKPARKSGGKRG